MRLVAGEPNATYVTINLGEIYIADNIKEKYRFSFYHRAF